MVMAISASAGPLPLFPLPSLASRKMEDYGEFARWCMEAGGDGGMVALALDEWHGDAMAVQWLKMVEELGLLPPFCIVS
jgi:hypothetical protein